MAKLRYSGGSKPPPNNNPVGNFFGKLGTTVSQLGQMGQAALTQGNRAVSQALSQAQKNTTSRYNPVNQFMNAAPTQRGEMVNQAALKFAGWATRNAGDPRAAAMQRYGNTSQTQAQQEQQRVQNLPDYAKGPGWVRSDYVPPVDYRYENAGMQMTANEYQARKRAQEKLWQPGMNEYLKAQYESAAATPNQPHWQADNRGNPASPWAANWAANNQKPAGFFQLEQERILRQNAAPPGMTYVPYGPSYIKEPSLASSPTVAPGQVAGPQSGGGSGYGDYGYGTGGPSYSYGTGGPSYGPAEQYREAWANMVNWAINQADRGG